MVICNAVFHFDCFLFTDKLDGLSHGMHKREKESSTTMEDYLQLSDDYFKRKSTPGKKMVSLPAYTCVLSWLPVRFLFSETESSL